MHSTRRDFFRSGGWGLLPSLSELSAGIGQVQRGVLLPIGTKPAEVFEVADQALPDMSYLSLAVTVKPLPKPWCAQAS